MVLTYSTVRYVLQRVGASALVLLGAVTVTFLLSHLIPVDPVTAWLGRSANPELIAIYKKLYHFDDPLYLQYFYYVNGLIHLELGFSPTRHAPVLAVISQTLPYTIQLIFLSMIITTVIGIPGGIISAKYAGRPLEKIIKISYIAGTSSPPFLVPIVLLLVFATLIPILPTSGPIGSMAMPAPVSGIPMVDAIVAGDWPAFLSLLQHAILPSLAIALALYGFLTRVLSSSIIEILGSNFVRAARARGLSENLVLYKYGLKNSLIQVITVLSLILTFVLGVDVFVETIFSYPGLGQFAVLAALSFDYPGILATTLVYAIIIVLTNVAADLLYFVVDPRVRRGQ